MTLSKIFDWFEEDFLDFERRQGSSSPRVLDYVNRYRSPDAKLPADYSLDYAGYDKRINSQ